MTYREEQLILNRIEALEKRVTELEQQFVENAKSSNISGVV